MEKLKTTDIPDAGSGGVKKVIEPGEHVIKINSVTFDKTPFKTEDSWNIHLHAETEPMGDDFDGFWVEKGDESKGKYKGQVARVRASEYAFKDGIVGSTSITRDREILKWLKGFTDAIGAQKWLLDQNDKHDTIEGLLEQLDKDKPFKDIWLSATLGGKAYKNKEDYLNYDLFLPKFTAKNVPIEKKGTVPSKLVPYNPEVHIKHSKPKVPAGKAASDFEL